MYKRQVVDLAHGIYKVKIPNYEIKFLFQNIIREWFNDKVIGLSLIHICQQQQVQQTQ